MTLEEQFPLGSIVRIISPGASEIWTDKDAEVVGYDHDTETNTLTFVRVRMDGQEGGWYPQSLERVGNTCPRCESDPIAKGDYLCEGCRYGY